MARLPEGSFSDRAEVVAAIAATGDPRAAAVLEALREGELHAAQGRRRGDPRHRARRRRPRASTR